MSKQNKRTCQGCLRFQSYADDKGKCSIKGEVEGAGTCEDFANSIAVRHDSDGWIFVCGRQTAGPFKYLDKVDDDEVSKVFGVQLKQVWKARMHVYSSETEPKSVKRTDVIELKSRTITPSFNGLSIRVHPAIGVVGERAYSGVVFPCTVLEKKKDGEPEASEQELLFFITNQREMLSADKETLSKINWKLAYRSASLRNRWSLESVQRFLNGETVDPAKIFNEVKQAWKTYADFYDGTYYDFVTLWIIGTYFFHLFNTYPYIYFGGVKRSGKTKALTLASTLAFNAIFSGNVTTSSVFRLIQSGRCSLLMDETDKLSNPDRAQEFRGLLLEGYKRGGVVYRSEKTKSERYVPEPFEIFSPKMLANIQGIEDVLEDRCITLIMKRARNKEILNREINIEDGYWQQIRDHLYILFLTYWKEISDLYSSFSEVSEFCGVSEGSGCELSGREFELWRPIFALAKFFDTHPAGSQTSETTLSSRVFDLAKRKSEERKIENMTETGDYILVQTLVNVISEERYYKVKEIRDAMTEHFDEEQKWLNTHWVGRALKRLGFVDKRRVGTGYEYRFSKQDIKDLAERLGIETPSEKDLRSIPTATKTEGIMSVRALDPKYIGPCYYCGKRVTLTWQVLYFNGDWADACVDCGTPLLEKVKARSEGA